MSSRDTGRPDGRPARWDRHHQQRRRQVLDAAVAAVQDGEPGEPGAELHVEQVVERVGLDRAVVHRPAADRRQREPRATRAGGVEDHGRALGAGLEPSPRVEDLGTAAAAEAAAR